MISKGKILLLIITIIFLGGFAFLSASVFNSLKPKIGVFAGVSSNDHVVSFPWLPGVPDCCVEYGDAKSMEPSFKLFAEVSLFDFLDIQIGASYNKIGANLEAPEFIGNTEVDDDVFPVFTTHYLESDLSVISFNPAISLIPYKDIPMRFILGFEIGTIIEKEIYQHEDLSKEAIENGIIFYDGSREVGTSRSIYEGDIPYVNTYNALSFSLAYDINITNKIVVRPEVSYKYCLKDIVPNVNWKINNTVFGISLCYDLGSDPFDMKQFQDTLIYSRINDEIEENENTLEDEVRKIEEYIEEYENSLDLAQEDDMKKPVEKPQTSGFTCCYVIFFSSDDLIKSEDIIESINNNTDLKGVFIQEWMNPDTEKIYYRVRTKCYDDYFKAMNIESLFKQENIKTGQPAIIKCF